MHRPIYIYIYIYIYFQYRGQVVYGWMIYDVIPIKGRVKLCAHESP